MSASSELASSPPAFCDLQNDSFDHSVSVIDDPDAKETSSSLAPVFQFDKAELECAPELGWASYLSAQGVIGAIVALTISGAAGQQQSHAYLIGFDDVRGDFAMTRWLLSWAEAIWGQIGASHQRPFTADEVLGLRRAVSGSVPVRAGAIDGLKLSERLGPAIALQARIKGVMVRGVFFKAAGAAQATASERREIDKLVPLFVEHGLVKANLRNQARQTAMLEAMFDRVSLPMLLMDANCRPIFANSSAEAVLRERKWLLRNPDGMLVTPNASATKELRAAVRGAVSGKDGARDQHVVRVEGPTGEFRLLQIAPPSFRQGGDAPGAAMMMVLSPGKAEASPLLLQALGLLPSEQKFLGRFLQSSNIGDAAIDCGISEETARTYLKRVRSKLGVSRQMELASLISSLALPLAESELIVQG